MANRCLLLLLVCLTIAVLVAVFTLVIVVSTDSDSSLVSDNTVESVSSTCSGSSSRSIPLDANSFFENDVYTTGAPVPDYPGDVDSRTEITVDQLIMGAGAGGLAVADHLSDAFKKAGMPV